MKFNSNPDYQTPFSAWSAGFTAAVAIILENSAQIPDSLEAALAAKPQDITQIDSDTLNLWLNVGRHTEHGAWAIAGARQATYMILLTLWDHTELQKPETLARLFKTVETSDPDFLSGMIATETEGNLDDIVVFTYLDAAASRLLCSYL